MNYKKALSLGVIFTFLSCNVVSAADIIKKDESVFVTLDSNGNPKETIVSDWLHSDSANIEIKDKSNLSSVINVKGYENPSMENGYINWKSDTNDIFYQGTTEKNIPLDVVITYFLDGKEITPDKLAGKSGKIKINIDFKNKDSHDIEINGKNKTIYTPLTTVAVINLPIDNFSEVTTTSGEIISDGNNQILTFIGFPGLKDSLDVGSDLINLPSSVTLEANAKNFKMGPIMITSTPKIPEVDDLKNANTIDELVSGVNQLQDAAMKLSEGTSKLAGGQKQLSDNLTNLKDGLNKLDSSSKDLEGGANKLSQGTGALSSGAKTLSDGTNLLTGGLSQLTDKSKKLTNGLNTLAESTTKIKAGQDRLTAGSTQLINGIQQLRDSKKKEIDTIKMFATSVDKLINIASLLPEGEIKTNLVGGLQKHKGGLEQLATKNNDFILGLNALEAGAKNIESGSKELSTYLSQLEAGQKTAANGSVQLSQGSEYILSKSKELSSGASKINGGLNELNTGAQGLNAGIKQYTNGVGTASDGAVKLSDGASKLLDGTNKLNVNMQKFNKEGIDKMTNTLKDKVENVEDLIALKDEIVKLSNNYGTFTGLSEGMEGNVKFIIKTDEIKVNEVKATTNQEVKTEHKGFIQWIKGLFAK